MPPSPLTIQLFGPLRVAVRGDPLPRVRTRSVEWLLALLTLRHGRAVPRSWLAGTLWPESGETRALQSLRDDLLRLRKALGPESGRIQSPARDSLQLDLTGAAVDVLQFDAAIQAGDEASLRGAVALYTGPLLEGCVAEWAFTERAACAEQCLAALETLAERAQERGDHGEAIRYLRRAQALDPLRDSLPCRLMTSLAAAGNPGAAIQTYRDFRQRLQEELATAPDEATTRLFHEIRAAARRPAVQRRLAPTPSQEIASGHIDPTRPTPEPLPLALTSLIGREQEVDQIREALQQSRLVTLIGGGGVGKTRLALELALLAREGVPDGAAWVELGPLPDGALVLPTVAAALGVPDVGAGEGPEGRGPGPGALDAAGVSAGGRAPGGVHDPDGLTRRLAARLGEGALLLVLDNCEHVLDAAAAVVRLLLQCCPALRVLATSRQRLGLAGEVVWRVPSLSVPGVQVFGSGTREAGGGVQDRPSQGQVLPVDPEHHHPLRGYPTRTPEHLMQYSAVRLFVERAAAARPGFRLASGAEAAAVGQICRRLDGIPLALELAAARVTVLPVAQIATRLDDRFKLLTRGARGALPRHQTLRALIDWSYDSLPAAEAALLRRLSVFAGGWTLEAAEAICADFGFRVPSGRLNFGLPSKADMSEDRTPSTLSDPIQNPNAQRTPEIQNEEVLDLLDALVDRSLVLVDEAADGLRYRVLETVREYAREKLAASEEVAAVRDRHRDWYLQVAEQSEAELLGPGRGPAWKRLEGELDNFRAALAWCQEAADAHLGSDAAEAGFRLAHALYWFWTNRGYLTEGLQWLEGAMARCQLSARQRASALMGAAHLARGRGDWERSITFRRAARRQCETVLELARRNGDRREVAWALLWLADASAQDEDDDTAWGLCLEARPLFEELADLSGRITTLRWLGDIALNRGDRRAARPLLEERMAICREWGDPVRLIHALGGMGHLERDEGNHPQARALYQESLLLRQQAGERFALAQSLEDLAVLAGREQQAERAIRLLGAGEAFCETLGARSPVALVAEYERTVAEGRAALGEAAFAAAWADGRAMSLDRAVEYALGEA